MFWEGGSLWIGLTNVRSEYHSHHAIQLGLALTGTAQFKTRSDPHWVHYAVDHERTVSFLLGRSSVA